METQVEVLVESKEECSSLSKLHLPRVIKKVYEIDHLECPKCHKEMKIISCIGRLDLIYKISKHLNLLCKDFDVDDEAEQSVRGPA